MTSGRASWIAWLGFFLPASVLAQPVREYTGVRTASPPRIDGDISDPAWQAARPASGFTQLWPDSGEPATYSTRVWILYDDRALYVAAHCHDPEPEKIIARVTRRDRWVESDWFFVSIDSRLDRRTGFFMGVNAGGVERDGTLFNEYEASPDWDGVWDSTVRVVDDGWQLEMKIPLKLLRFRAGPDVSFGLNLERRIGRIPEVSLWQPIPPESRQWVSRFGLLTGLELSDPPLQFEVAPYVVTRPSFQTGGADEDVTRFFDAGVDGQVALGSNFMLTYAANPDFGQVEVDQVVLNLSTIETYFPEKRPFFLEDRSLFNAPGFHGPTQAELFYTRRIGRAARWPEAEDGEELVRPPALPRIYGAAKLAGQTGGKLSVGLLQAVTSRETAGFRSPARGRYARLAEPLTSYSILRLKQDFWKHSAVGLTSTATATPDDGSAITGGADLQMELFDDQYNLTAVAFYSYLTEERFGWQDDFTRAALEDDGSFGYGGQLELAKTGGDHLVGSLKGFYYSPNLALNDLGYLDRGDRLFLSANLQHHRMQPIGPLARYYVKLGSWIDRNSDFVNLGDGFSLDAWVEFKNGWGAGGWFFFGLPLCDDRETRSKGRVSLCSERLRPRGGFFLWSNEKYMISGSLDVSLESTQNGWALRAMLPLKLTPHPRVQLELAPGYNRSTGKVRWIDTLASVDGDRYLFADQHSEYWDLTLRGTCTFTTELSVQAYAQAFLAAVDHGNKYQAPTPAGRTIHVEDLAPAGGVSDDYDYTDMNLNLSVVLRWEYLPGSIAYLVYTGAFGDDLEAPDFRFGDLFGELPGLPARHVLLFKISYFWG